MARTGSTGVIAIVICPTLANPAAPTLAEIAAGVDVTPWLTRDGLTTPLDGSTIDVAGANTRYNATASGSYGGQPISMRFFRDDDPDDDIAWDTLPRQTKAYAVVRRFGGATGSSDDPFLAAQKVESWPIDVLSRTNMPIADNEGQKFEVSAAVPGVPSEDAVVAAA